MNTADIEEGTEGGGSSSDADAPTQSEWKSLRTQNEELQAEVARLRQLVGGNSSGNSSAGGKPVPVTSGDARGATNDEDRNLRRSSSSISDAPCADNSDDNDQELPCSHQELPCSRSTDSTDEERGGEESSLEMKHSCETKKSADGGGAYFKALLGDGDEDTTQSQCTADSDDDSSHNEHVLQREQAEGSPGAAIMSPRSKESAFPSARDQLGHRAGWLIGLLFLQSCSSFIISSNEKLLKSHMVIVQFLTMLVGAGGNAGNQAAVNAIRNIAIGTLHRRTIRQFLAVEAKMAVCLAGLIGLTGFVRAYLFGVPWGETVAITTSVVCIVAISVGIGSTLPLAMKRVGIDPANSATTIQVIMDILGVLITVTVSSFVLSFPVFQREDALLDEDAERTDDGPL